MHMRDVVCMFPRCRRSELLASPYIHVCMHVHVPHPQTRQRTKESGRLACTCLRPKHGCVDPQSGFSGWARARFSKVVINAFDYMHCTIAARIHAASLLDSGGTICFDMDELGRL
jgi:hypothetical protein